MKAIITDIHSNIEALTAVLEDIADRGIEEIICLGDVIGYGPNPKECIDLAMKFNVVLMGNHEDAVLNEATDFNARAELAINWTRDQLTGPDNDGERDSERCAFLAARPERDANGDGELLFVHGSPRKPVREYIFPRDMRNRAKMAEIFGQVSHYCFVGHTHVPGVFTDDLTYTHPLDLLKQVYILDEEKAIINPGSVGQPRDGDCRASYVTFDGDSVVFRRVEYDVMSTAKKILRTQGLDDDLGERLKEGR